jgi:hypothetical protein
MKNTPSQSLRNFPDLASRNNNNNNNIKMNFIYIYIYIYIYWSGRPGLVILKERNLGGCLDLLLQEPRPAYQEGIKHIQNRQKKGFSLSLSLSLSNTYSHRMIIISWLVGRSVGRLGVQ